MLSRLEDEVEMLERHLRVLVRVAEDEPVGIHSLSEHTEIPHHKVRYSLRILEEHDIVEPTENGAAVTETGDELVDEIDEQLDAVVAQVRDIRDAVTDEDAE